MSMKPAERVKKWCDENGFSYDARNNGVICKRGTSNLVFSISHQSGVMMIVPDGFAWTPHARLPGHPLTMTLLPYPGDTINQFLGKLTKSHENAMEGINSFGKPYDQKAVWRLAQEDFLKERRNDSDNKGLPIPRITPPMPKVAVPKQ